MEGSVFNPFTFLPPFLWGKVLSHTDLQTCEAVFHADSDAKKIFDNPLAVIQLRLKIKGASSLASPSCLKVISPVMDSLQVGDIVYMPTAEKMVRAVSSMNRKLVFEFYSPTNKSGSAFQVTEEGLEPCLGVFRKGRFLKKETLIKARHQLKNDKGHILLLIRALTQRFFDLGGVKGTVPFDSPFFDQREFMIGQIRSLPRSFGIPERFFQLASDRLRKDRKFIKASIRVLDLEGPLANEIDGFCKLNPQVLNFKRVARLWVWQGKGRFSTLNEDLQKDPDIAFVAVRKDPEIMEGFDAELKASVLDLAFQYYQARTHFSFSEAPEVFRDNEGLVERLVAVSESYLNPVTDRVLWLEPYVNSQFAARVKVSRNGHHLARLPMELQRDPEVVIQALYETDEAIKHVPKDLFGDQTFMLAVGRRYFKIYSYASKFLKKEWGYALEMMARLIWQIDDPSEVPLRKYLNPRLLINYDFFNDLLRKLSDSAYKHLDPPHGYKMIYLSADPSLRASEEFLELFYWYCKDDAVIYQMMSVSNGLLRTLIPKYLRREKTRFFKLPKKLQEKPFYALHAVKAFPSIYERLNPDLQQNLEIAAERYRYDLEGFAKAPRHVKTNIAVVTMLVQLWGDGALG